MKLLLGSVLILSLFTVSFAYGNEWYDEDWQFAKRITINGTQAGGAFLDFPVLINITSDDLRDNANITGTDILFTSDNNYTKLNHELEYYHSGTGWLIAWVQVPVLTGDNQDIYMYYGDTNNNGHQNNTQATWHERYRGVWHFQNNFKDSTSYGNDGINDGTTNATCTIGLCRSFDEINDAVEIPVGTGQYNFTMDDPFTLQAIGNWDGTHTDGVATIISKWKGFGGGYKMYGDNLAGKELINVIYTITGSDKSRSTPSAIMEDTPMMLAMTWHGINSSDYSDPNRNSVHNFVNGTKWEKWLSSQPFTNDIADDSVVRIGESSNGNQQWKGTLDEIRIVGEELPDDWISTEYNNTQTHTINEFLIVGNEGTNPNANLFDRIHLQLAPEYRNHIVQTRNTDTTTDLDRGAGSPCPPFPDLCNIEVPITGIIDYLDEESFEIAGNGIRCLYDGRAKITASLYLSNDGTQRTNTELQIYINDTSLGAIGASAYIRESSAHERSSVHITAIGDCVENHIINIRAAREGTSGQVFMASEGTSILIVERI